MSGEGSGPGRADAEVHPLAAALGTDGRFGLSNQDLLGFLLVDFQESLLPFGLDK
ncbi:hypothetical protein [Microtetraspora malaysiensis]|uniref:hypothetical protein n=1 Tax=Microtetraspora malaysiensis TaxID=161358 RepID=UPI003D8A6219